MAGVNKVILVGRLGKDPEFTTMGNGKELAKFPLATSETWKDRNTGERQEKTEWHNIVIFNDGLVNVVKNYVKKGSQLYIEGQLQTRKWEGQDGVERYNTDIILSGFNGTLVMLDSRNANGGGGNFGGGSSSSSSSSNQSGGNFGGGSDPFAPSGNDIGADLDDEIPF